MSLDVDDKTFAKRVVQLYKGGACSFNDLVLSSGANLFVEENNRLDELREWLYQSAVEVLVGDCPDAGW